MDYRPPMPPSQPMPPMPPHHGAPVPPPPGRPNMADKIAKMNELQKMVLLDTTINNPLLPATNNPITNKALKTNDKRVIPAINEVLDLAIRVNNTLGSFKDRYNTEIGPTIDDPDLLNDLHKIDENVIKAILKIKNDLDDFKEEISDNNDKLKEIIVTYDYPIISDTDISNNQHRLTFGPVDKCKYLDLVVSGAKVNLNNMNYEIIRKEDFNPSDSTGSIIYTTSGAKPAETSNFGRAVAKLTLQYNDISNLLSYIIDDLDSMFIVDDLNGSEDTGAVLSANQGKLLNEIKADQSYVEGANANLQSQIDINKDDIISLNSRVGVIESNVNNNANDILTNRTDIDELESNIADIETRVNELEAATPTDSLLKTIFEVDDLENAKLPIEDVQLKSKFVGDNNFIKVEDINGKTTIAPIKDLATSDDLTILDSKLDTEIAKLEVKLATHETQFANDADVKAIQNQLPNFIDKTAYQQQVSAISALSNSITSTDSTVNALRTNVADAETKIQNVMETLSNAGIDPDVKLSTVAANLSTLETHVDDIMAGVTDVYTRANLLAGDNIRFIRDDTTNPALVRYEITTNFPSEIDPSNLKLRIDASENDIQTISTQIESLITKDTTHTNNITDVNDKISALRHETTDNSNPSSLQSVLNNHDFDITEIRKVLNNLGINDTLHFNLKAVLDGLRGDLNANNALDLDQSDMLDTLKPLIEPRTGTPTTTTMTDSDGNPVVITRYTYNSDNVNNLLQMPKADMIWRGVGDNGNVTGDDYITISTNENVSPNTFNISLNSTKLKNDLTGLYTPMQTHLQDFALLNSNHLSLQERMSDLEKLIPCDVDFDKMLSADNIKSGTHMNIVEDISGDYIFNCTLDVVNDLNYSDPISKESVLSAYQGHVLAEEINTVKSNVNTNTTNIGTLTTRLNELIYTDWEQTENINSKVASYKLTKELYEDVEGLKSKQVDVIDNLTTEDETKALSANQGVILKLDIDNIKNQLVTLDNRITTNTSNITLINTEIETNIKPEIERIDPLEARIKQLEDSFADLLKDIEESYVGKTDVIQEQALNAQALANLS